MDLRPLVREIIPPLSADKHKGQAGRIGIVGGSSIFTGAPYFAAMSAMKTGCDLAYLFCTKDASPVIKSYSPDLMIHPFLDSEIFPDKIAETFPILHSIVVGPGLGRDPAIINSLLYVIKEMKDRKIPAVFDADALHLILKNPGIVHSYTEAILTPNVREFTLLHDSVSDKILNYTDISEDDVKELAKCLGNVTIALKGPKDIISNGVECLICDEPGSLRRCGGQGDILAGTMGTFTKWAHDATKKQTAPTYAATLLAAAGACLLTRRCSFLAFQKHQRSMVTSDMLAEINHAFSSLFC